MGPLHSCGRRLPTHEEGLWLKVLVQLLRLLVLWTEKRSTASLTISSGLRSKWEEMSLEEISFFPLSPQLLATGALPHSGL